MDGLSLLLTRRELNVDGLKGNISLPGKVADLLTPAQFLHGVSIDLGVRDLVV
jgi:hypothetical protein